MKNLKRVFLYIITIFLGLYVFAIVLVYFMQEQLLFHPAVVDIDYLSGNLPPEIEEKFIPVDKNVNLHGLLFKAQNPKGLVFYLHGNGGNAYGWGQDTAELFTGLEYDLFILDYRVMAKA